MSLSETAFAIVPAAGSGQRMGLNHSKLLCRGNGQSILFRTLSILNRTNRFARIIVPCRPQDMPVFRAETAEIADSLTFVAGGKTRQESVKAALVHLRDSNLNPADQNSALILIHDAARCFVSEGLIANALDIAAESRAVTAAIDCVDTIYSKNSLGNIALPLLERNGLATIQTPQVFDLQLLWNAHSSEELASDDAGLVARIHPVRLIPGEISNIKITTKDQLQLL